MSELEFEKRRKKELLNQAIKNNGFYGKNGLWNSIITFPGDKTIYRHRVETIIVKNNKLVFVKKKFNGGYYLPGGSCEKDVPNIDQAVNECREEAHIDVKNIESTGITYKEKQDPPNWCKTECDIQWNGYFTEVYVADYGSKFNGHIDDADQDPFILSGNWYTTKECFSFFRKEHKEALLFYLKNHQETTPVTESYISNYFANKRLLKKISHNPEIERDAVIIMIDKIKAAYNELASKSKIQRERKRPDVGQFFHPVLSFDFEDKSTVTIVLCFDDSEFTDGAAVHTDEYGDLIVIYPGFMKERRETQIFTILHEFGHIRLNHLEVKNNVPFFFAKDNDQYRSKIMNKGKVMYPEMNADLYAVLNGASMYSILSSSYSKDFDKQYDYRFTNAELASRYTGVFKQYKKLKKFQEGEDTYMDFNITKYDLACSTIYEMVYQNDKTSHLSNNDKDKLYNVLYEFAINKNIKDDPNVIRAEKEYAEACEQYKAKEALYNKYNNICNMNESELSLNDIDFKNMIEENTISEIPVLVNDMYNLQNRFETASDALSYARGKAYNNYRESFESAGYLIGPATLRNEKAVIIASEKYTIEQSVYDLVDKIIDKILVTESTSSVSNNYLVLLESLSTKERNKIPEDEFGIPEKRAYPLDSKKHILSAIRLFGHCEPKYRKDLATKIFSAMKEYDIPMDIIGDKSKLREYM